MIDGSNPFHRKDFKGEAIKGYSGTTEDEADRLVLDELRVRGADLSLPRHIVHHLWFDAATQREQAAAVTQGHGYDVGLPDQENAEEPFLLRAERTGIAKEATLRTDRLVLSDIAEAHDGWYDGWAAAEDQ